MKTKFKALIILGATVLSFAFSIFSHMFLMPVLALAALIAVEWGLGCLAPVIAAVAAGVFITGDFSVGNIVTAVYLAAVPMILAVYGKRRIKHRYAALVLAAVITLGIYLSMTLGSLIRGLAPHAEAMEAWNVMTEEYSALFKGSYGYEDMMELFDLFGEALPDALMPASILLGEIYALGLIVFYQLWAKLFRVETLKMAQLPEWRLPRNLHWGSLVLVVIAAVGYIVRLERANAIAFSFAVIVVPLFAAQGLAFFLYLFEKTKAPAVARVLLFVSAALFFPYSLLLLAAFGVREQIQNRRRLMREYLNDKERNDRFREEISEYDKYGYIRKKDDKDNNDSEEDKK